MTSQHKSQSHRKETLIALRWQVAILGASIFYFILEYFLNRGIHVWEIRALFIVGFGGILIAVTFLLVIRFNKYLQLSEHVILSYDLSLIILYMSVPFTILFVIIPFMGVNLLGSFSEFLSSDPFNFSIRSMLLFIIFFEGYLHIVPLIAVKHFRYYYAKALVRNSLYEQKEDEVKRLKYLFAGINSYRKYLGRHLDLDINVPKVYPRITVLTPQERIKLVNSMYEAFSADIDKLKPIICLTTFLNLPADEVLVKEPIKDKIKQLSLLFIPIITVIISVFQLLFK